MIETRRLKKVLMAFYTMISVLYEGSCFNALDYVELMSRSAVTCGSNKRRRTSIGGVLRFLQLILNCTLLIENILSFKDAG